MAEHPHLLLPRAQNEIERRKKPGFGSRPERSPEEQLERIRVAVEGVLAIQAAAPIRAINPGLIVRVRTSGVFNEEEWQRANLTLLATNEDQSIVLFSSDADLQEFRRRLNAYGAGVPEGQQNPAYASLIAGIEEFGAVRPQDRIGPMLRSQGMAEPYSFGEREEYRLDVELWETGTQDERSATVNALEAEIQNRGGRITDRYIGRTLTLFRVIGSGTLIRDLLAHQEVANIDAPPTPDDLTSELLEFTADDVPAVAAPPDGSPSVGILDSGLTAAHPLIATAVSAAIGVPESLRADDVKGHGTRVAGIALYGDIRRCVTDRAFTPTLLVHSAKVVNDLGKFDDNRLVPSQMRDAITTLRDQGCRIFNVSLCDATQVYAGGKVSPWAAALDELARSLDVVIIVSAGNYKIPAAEIEAKVAEYPRYLLNGAARLFEPATAAIPLTVGAIAESSNTPPMGSGNVALRPVAAPNQPSPFTRTGPGPNGIIKPDLCDYGGNLLFDGTLQTLVSYDEAAVLTLHHEYLRRLLTTTVGTSLAAPRVAHKAAQLLRTFPEASANLIRAFLVSSAQVPEATIQCLQGLGPQAAANVCGNGIADLTRAQTSDNNRVVLYAQDAIGLDRFFVYEIPIPEEFIGTPGERQIQVTLAFDPPTRHTRIDYLGTRMSFRLNRGMTLEQVVEFYRRRTKDEGEVPDVAQRFNCDLNPGPNVRDKCTVQKAVFSMHINPRIDYGDTYYLVVRCERQWAGDEDSPQKFAAVVEISHRTENSLYERIKERLRVRVRA